MNDSKSTSLCAVHTMPGVIPHWTKPGQIVAWNMVGQVAFAESSSITILTPYTPPPAAVAKLVNKSRPPPPATAIVVHEETEEAPTIPPEFDRIPCWKGRFAVETTKEPTLNADVTQLLLELNEASMLFRPKDPGVKALAWSPKGLAPLGGCLLAVLETNLNLTIRSTEKDYIQGAWLDTCNLTHETYKLSAGSPETQNGEASANTDSSLHRAKELLFQCISWSTAPILPFPWGARPHDSLLAVAGRSGSLALWQFNSERQWTRVWNQIIVGQWIVHLAWSEWATTGTDTIESTSELAFACTDGSVYSTKVRLQFGSDGHHTSVDVGQPTMHIPPGTSAITGLQFVHGHIVCTRTGTVQIAMLDNPSIAEIQLSKIGNWPSCSRCSPCNGIGALSEGCILISCYSGEQHVIRIRDGRPVLDSAASERLSSGLRGDIEGADISIDEAITRKSPRLTGFTLAPAMIGDGGSTLFACVLEPANLHDFEFPKDNNRKHTLILGNLATHLLGDSREEVDLASRSSTSIFDSYAALQTASSALLPCLPGILPPKIMSRLLKASMYLSQTGPATNPPNATTREMALANLRYCWIDSRRAKIFQLVNVWRIWNESSEGTPFDHANRGSAQDIILGPAFAYMAAVNGLEGGVPAQTSNLDMICRILQLNATSAPSEDIQKHRRQLTGSLPQDTDIVGRISDTCLICSESIPFDVKVEQVAPALCRKKHVWGRCSITYRLITTPFVRTCATCHAKSLLPNPKNSEHEWSIEQDLLCAATSCPRCGGLWRSVV